ncbi:MAG: hypothetical protein H7144_07100 [Burkholderiales bacterium]|nr:hypothetical protein [Phycisphaerae bacterium]
MTDRKLFVPALAGVLGFSALAAAAEPTAAELREQIDALQAKVSKIEARQASASEQQATVASVLNDAERRSQLMQTGAITSGYDKGFFVRSADGNFSVKPGLQFQFRSVANFAEDAKVDGDDSLETGFEVRRARFRFDGNAISKDLTYSFVWDSSRSSGSVSLLDAYVQYKFADEMAVKVGQFKESWTHEKDVSSFRQTAVERSIVDALLGGATTDRVQGIALVYGGEGNPFRGELALHDGANSKNTTFEDTTSNYGVGARVEYKVYGDWGAYKDFTAKGSKDNLLVIGGGFDYTESGDSNLVRATVDAQWENTTGLGIYAGVIGNYSEVDEEGSDGSSDNYGFVGQVSYALDPSWEIFGRYGLVMLDDDITDEDTINEITIGANYYLGTDGSAMHNAKIQLDLVWLPDGSPDGLNGLGYVASDEQEFVFRGQFQLAL